jgi:hypothetical protein
MHKYEFYFKALPFSTINGWIDCMFTYEAENLDRALELATEHNPVGAISHYLVSIFCGREVVWQKEI